MRLRLRQSGNGRACDRGEYHCCRSGKFRSARLDFFLPHGYLLSGHQAARRAHCGASMRLFRLCAGNLRAPNSALLQHIYGSLHDYVCYMQQAGAQCIKCYIGGVVKSS